MLMELQDDRTPEQKKTHKVLIGGTDTFLSGWGKAKGGKSFAFWACTYDNADKVFQWVSNRSDIKKVRYVSSNYRPNAKGHCHIYVVTENHPAI